MATAVRASAQELADSAFLSLMAYSPGSNSVSDQTGIEDDDPDGVVTAHDALFGSGWAVLDPDLLIDPNVPALATGHFEDGYYNPPSSIPFVDSGVHALVAVKDGVLCIAIRGSDGGVIFDFSSAAFDQSHYFELMRPLFDAVLEYIREDALSPNPTITKLLVTGHSLGGIMAQWFAHVYGNRLPTGVDASIATFGSPGAAPLTLTLADLADDAWSRSEPNALANSIVNIGHDEDGIFEGNYPGIIGFQRAGLSFVINVHDEEAFAPLDFTEHSQVLYRESINLLDQSGFFDRYLDSPESREIIADSHVSSTFFGGTVPAADDDLLIDVSSYTGKTLIVAGDGADTVRGGHESDWIDGGIDGDTLYGNAGDDEIFGGIGAGSDVIYGGTGFDILSGGGGADKIYGEVGDDVLHGGAGFYVDQLWGGTEADTFIFDNADDTNTIDFVRDYNHGDGDLVDLSAVTLDGDRLHVTAEHIRVIVAPFGDYSRLQVETPEDGWRTIAQLDGIGLGDEVRIKYAALLPATDIIVTSAIVVPPPPASPPPPPPPPTADDFQGGPGGDVWDGTALDDAASGGGGNDTLSGLGGADALWGDADDDQLFGGAGQDYLSVAGGGNDSAYGGDDDDVFFWSGAGVKFLSGGAGDDYALVNLSHLTDSIFFELSRDNATSQGSSWTSIETFDVTLGAGDDVLRFEPLTPGVHIANGGGGVDILSVTNELGRYSGEAVVLVASASVGGPGFVQSASGAFRLDFTGFERLSVVGGIGDDILIAGDSDDRLFGPFGGNDLFYGGGGNDELIAGEGVDVILGGDGNDILTDFGGDGLLDGGSGDDQFNVEGAGTRFIDGGAGFDSVALIVTGGTDAFGLALGATLDLDPAIDAADANPGGVTLVNVEKVDVMFNVADDRVRFGSELSGEHTVVDNGGFDTLIVDWSGLTEDVMLSSPSLGIEPNLSDVSGAYRIDFTGIERLEVSGGSGNDDLRPNQLSGPGGFSIGVNQVHLQGNGGDDLLVGTSGSDILEGGEGNDTLAYWSLFAGWEGHDVLLGGDGNDSIFAGGSGVKTIDGGSGDDSLSLRFEHYPIGVDLSFGALAAGVQTLPDGTTIANIETIELVLGSTSDRVEIGSAFAGINRIFMGAGTGHDTLIVDWSDLDADSTLTASPGNLAVLRDSTGSYGVDFYDVNQLEIRGGSGDDTLNSFHSDGVGSAILYGNGGNDTLIIRQGTLHGGDGDDTMQAGASVDTFGYNAGNDTIVGFQNGLDLIDITAIAAVRDVDGIVARASELSAGVLRIDFGGGNTLTVNGLSLAGLSADDFIFATPSNTAPSDILLTPAAVDEDVVVGAVVGALSASDIDADETFDYMLIDDAGGRFALSDGDVVLAMALDHEAAASHDIAVRVTDSAGNVFGKTITITVGNVNEAPVIAGGDAAALTVAENSTAVTTIAANDPDAGQAVRYRIAGGVDASRFTVDLIGGALAFALAPDFEARADADGDGVYEVVVEAYDDDGASDAQALSITVGNVAGVVITGTGGNNTINATQTVTGQPRPTDEEDTINAGGGTDTVNALGGDDIINGGAGGDTLRGGAGNDFIDGGAGDDTMFGGVGDDTFVFSGTGDAARESANEGIDTIQSAVTLTLPTNVENLTLTGTANINGTGNGLANVIIGNSGRNTLSGGGGDDALDGGGGADTLNGEAGNDTLFGGAGADVLTGGAGADVMSGGAGADRFVFSAIGNSAPATPDEITDFLHSTDLFDLSAIDARTGVGGNQAFLYRGQNVSAVANSITWYEADGRTYMQGDVNGNTTADVLWVLTGTNHQLTTADFLL